MTMFQGWRHKYVFFCQPVKYTQGKKKRTTYFFKVFARILWNQMYVFESHICPWHFSPVIWDSRLARSRTCTIFTMPVLFPKKKWKFYVVRFFFPWVYVIMCTRCEKVKTQHSRILFDPAILAAFGHQRLKIWMRVWELFWALSAGIYFLKGTMTYRWTRFSL